MKRIRTLSHELTVIRAIVNVALAEFNFPLVGRHCVRVCVLCYCCAAVVVAVIIASSITRLTVWSEFEE